MLLDAWIFCGVGLLLLVGRLMLLVVVGLLLKMMIVVGCVVGCGAVILLFCVCFSVVWSFSVLTDELLILTLAMHRRWWWVSAILTTDLFDKCKSDRLLGCFWAKY